MLNFIKERFVFEFYNEWSQLFGKYNWCSFTLFWIYFEKDSFTDGYEFHFHLLGFGFYIRYNTANALEIFDGYLKEVKKTTKKAKTVKKVKKTK